MGSNRKKINKKNFLQIFLVSLGILIIFLTYFEKDKKILSTKKIEEKEVGKIENIKEGLNTFENITYEGLDSNNNEFIIDAKYAEFTAEESNIIYMNE